VSIAFGSCGRRRTGISGQRRQSCCGPCTACRSRRSSSRNGVPASRRHGVPGSPAGLALLHPARSGGEHRGPDTEGAGHQRVYAWCAIRSTLPVSSSSRRTPVTVNGLTFTVLADLYFCSACSSRSGVPAHLRRPVPEYMSRCEMVPRLSHRRGLEGIEEGTRIYADERGSGQIRLGLR